MYYNTVFFKLELLLSLTNKQSIREGRNGNTFKTANSSKHKSRINQNSDKKKKAKLDSTARTHFVPDDHKYPFRERKEILFKQQK